MLHAVASGVSFGVLGELVAVQPGRTVRFGVDRRGAVLAALLVNVGSPVSVAQLVEMVWGDAPPPTAPTMVHAAVGRIRTALEPGRGVGHGQVVTSRAGSYVVELGPDVGLDATAFERLVVEGRAVAGASPSRAVRLLSEALDLWRGPAFAGIEQPFARDEASRLEEARLQCVEQRADAQLALGRHHALVAELEPLVAAHPMRERLTAQLVLALYRCERAVDALAACRRLRMVLDDELGVEPGPRLRRLETQILNHSDGLLWAGPTAASLRGGTPLPASISSFIGRERELADIAALLQANRFITLTGAGGSGKTRLAVEVARRIPVEVVFVDLSRVTTPDLFDGALADAVGVLAEGRTVAAAVAAAFSGAEVIIVLDNCEHLLECCARFVQAVLAAAAGLRVLATSREQVSLPGERLYPVGPLRLHVGAEAGWEQTADCEAVRLFADRAAAVHPGFTVTPANAALVHEVCSRLDGLPLALELAAARASAMPLRDIAARLDDRFRLLDAVTRTADLRHRSLKAAVAWSHDLLPVPERALFARLAVFPAGFDLAAAEAVATMPDADQVAVIVTHLVACSLVQVDARVDGRMRYRLLETTRAFAWEQLTGAERATLRQRHARHYLAVVDEAAPHLFCAGSARWLADLRLERDNLRAALEWAAGTDGDPLVLVHFVEGLWHYWDLRGSRGEGLRWVHAGLDAIGAEHLDHRLALLSAGALMHLGRAEFDVTEDLAREQLRLARAVGDRRWEGDGLAMIATVAWARGTFDKARQLYEDAVAASVAGGDLWRTAMEEAQLARLHRDRREPDAARSAAQRAVTHADEVGEELARGLSRDVLASVEHRWGVAASARRLIEDALLHYRLVDYREGEASALHLLGQIALADGDGVHAGVCFERSLQLCRRIGHRAGVAVALEGMAGVATAAGDTDGAARLLGEAAVVRAEIGVPPSR